MCAEALASHGGLLKVHHDEKIKGRFKDIDEVVLRLV